MWRRLLGRLGLAVSIAFLAMPAGAAEPQVYKLAVVPQFDLRRLQSVWGPIVEQLQNATGAKFELVLEPGIPAFEKGLQAVAYDIAYMNPYHYVIASKRHGYRAILRDVDEMLYGIVVVRKTSAVVDIHALDGLTVAFPSPNAMGAALIPRAEFATKFAIKVKEKYVKSHSSAYLNVLMGEADAAGGIKATFEQQPSEIKDGLRILYETDRYMPHPVAVHPRLSAVMAGKVQAELLALGARPAGAALLAEVPFRRLGIAVDSEYDQLRKLGLDAFYVEP